MIPHRTRRLYFTVCSVPMRLNHWRYRLFAAPRCGLRVHLGCGRRAYLPGWMNVDANVLTARPDLWINLLHGLPFRAGSVELFYTNQVLEHVPEQALPGLLAEMFRCLGVGGGVRIGVPHAGNAYRMYAAGRADWFGRFPSQRQSLGGRCANFLLCGNEHLGLLDFSYLEELLTAAGFSDVRECLPCRESRFVSNEVLKLEEESDFETPHVLIVEATKRRLAAGPHRGVTAGWVAAEARNGSECETRTS